MKPGLLLQKSSLSTKFTMIVGAIVFFICAASSLILYTYLKQKAIEDTYEKSKIVFYLMDAVGAYVRGTLRPKMFEVLSQTHARHDFVAEAMSTTRIKHGIVQQLKREIPYFDYRRVSDNPRNIKNKAEGFTLDMIKRFRENPDLDEWHGVANVGGKRLFFVLKPIRTRKECLRCHGKPEEAPPGLLAQYGPSNGFYRKVGDIAGLEAVSIPFNLVLAEIRNIAITIMGVGIAMMFFLFAPIEVAFLRLVTQPLHRLTDSFKAIDKGDRPLGETIPVTSSDEIGEVTESFNTMAKHLAEAQETLKANTELLQSIVNGISDPLALADTDCSLAVVNNAYQAWIAKESPAVLGYSCHELAHQSETLCPACLLEEVLATGKEVNGEWKGPDGRYYFTQLYPIYDEDGEVKQVVHYIRDMTLLKQAEAKMMQAEQLASLGQLAAGVAHEINNPLSTILCYVKILLKGVDNEKPIAKDLGVIQKHAVSCSKIVDSLLSFARQSKTSRKMCDINETLTEIVGMVKKQFEKDGVKINCQLEPNIPRLLIDPDKMKQVFMNLLMNAKQAITGKGKVEISSRYVPTKHLVEIEIADNGHGIDAHILDKIFDPFFTTKKTGEGTGLGLSVSYGIVKEHGGEIQVESHPGRGAKFTIIVPAQ